MPDQDQTHENPTAVTVPEPPSPAESFPEAFIRRKKQLQAQAEERWAAYRINRLVRLDITRRLLAFLKPFVENGACLENGWRFGVSVSEDEENQMFVVTGAFIPNTLDLGDEPLIVFITAIGDNALGWFDILYHSEMGVAEDLESLQDVLAHRLADLIFDFRGPTPDESTAPTEEAFPEPRLASETDAPEEINVPPLEPEDLPLLEDLSGTLGWVHLNSLREMSSIELKKQLEEFSDNYSKQVAFEILPAEEYFFSTDPGDLNAKLKAFRLLMWAEGKQSAADLESILLEAITSGYLSIEDAKTTEVVDCLIPALDTPEERLAQIAENLRKGG